MNLPSVIRELDSNDSLAKKRKEFLLPPDVIYMDGNSLGPSTIAARDAVLNVTKNQWQNDLIAGWNKHQWIDLPIKVGDKISPLLGAEPGQVVCTDSVSVNLFKVLSSALRLNSDRKIVISESGNFPTDLYIAQGLQSLLGKENCHLKTVQKSEILSSLSESVAVLMLTQVDFRTGEKLDIQTITRAAHKHGIIVIWDLAHSAGALPLELDHWQVDFAVGCGYKYLNGGPGAPAFVYAANRHITTLSQPLSGWMGHQAPFDFAQEYRPSQSINKMQSGTPSIIALSALNGALDVFQNLDLAVVQQKSLQLKNVFLETLSLSEFSELTLITPRQEDNQGSQLSFTHADAYALCQALIDNGVIVDFRAPNIIRFGFTPLYLSFGDVFIAANKLQHALVEKTYQQPHYQVRNKVT